MSGDPGLFGPQSITWRVHADPVMGLAGLRALFLQALHPLAMAGVAQHSDFRTDPWGRLFRTAEFVGVSSFGTVEEAERAAARVRGIHRKLSGIEPESGTAYRVDDPELLRWVHCCEVDSFLSTYRRCGGSLTDADADRYLTEQLQTARLVGLPAAGVPTSLAQMSSYFEQMQPQLRASTEANRAARFVLVPPMPRLVAAATPARPAWVGVAGLGFALLPRWARKMYRLPGIAPTDIGATVAGRALRIALMRLPDNVRTGPHVKAARARLEREPSAIRRLSAVSSR